MTMYTADQPGILASKRTAMTLLQKVVDECSCIFGGLWEYVHSIGSGGLTGVYTH